MSNFSSYTIHKPMEGRFRKWWWVWILLFPSGAGEMLRVWLTWGNLNEGAWSLINMTGRCTMPFPIFLSFSRPLLCPVMIMPVCVCCAYWCLLCLLMKNWWWSPGNLMTCRPLWGPGAIGQLCTISTKHISTMNKHCETCAPIVHHSHL